MTNKTMRDAFFDRLYDIAKLDRNVVLISVDTGAPSLDAFRRDLPNQYINVGIAEMNAINVAVGLTMGGKKVFVYGISPFVSMRCYEAVRVNMGIMNVPVTIVGVGTGFSYDMSGYTHNSLEDIAIMRAIPHLVVLNPSDSVVTSQMVDYCYNINAPCYVRLDREKLPVGYTREYMSDGLSEIVVGSDYTIVSTGNMVHVAYDVALRVFSETGKFVQVIDVFRLEPFNSKQFLSLTAGKKKIVTIEEHFLEGGLGSIVAETLADNGVLIPLLRIGVPKDVHYVYGRQNIHKYYGLDSDSLTQKLLDFFK